MTRLVASEWRPECRKDIKNPIKNNLVIELHVPDLDTVRSFYSKLGFEVSMNNKLNAKELGYLTMTREDKQKTSKMSPTRKCLEKSLKSHRDRALRGLFAIYL